MAGRPRKHANNAEKQKAYRDSKSVTKLVKDLQAVRKSIAAHGPFQPNPDWITRSAQLFDDFWRAQRRLLAVDPKHPAAFSQLDIHR